jgi:hypothetical protein
MSRSYGSRDAALRSTSGRTADSRESGDRLTTSSLIRVHSWFPTGPFAVAAYHDRDGSSIRAYHGRSSCWAGSRAGS